MINLIRKHNCPVCGKLTFGTPKESGITWDICLVCDLRQEQTQLSKDSHRGKTKGQHSA